MPQQKIAELSKIQILNTNKILVLLYMVKVRWILVQSMSQKDCHKLLLKSHSISCYVLGYLCAAATSSSWKFEIWKPNNKTDKDVFLSYTL